MKELVWMQRRLIRELCKLPEGHVVDADWLKAVWKNFDPDWVSRFWGQTNNGPRGKAIRTIAAAPEEVKREIKRISWQHFQIEWRYEGRVQGRIEVFNWNGSEVYKQYKLLMISFYEDWLRRESIPTPEGSVSVKSLYSSGLGSAHVCPYCDGLLDSSNRRIDHFFPDSQFPALSVSLSNLIPVCETCNGISRKHNNPPYPPDAVDFVAECFHP